MGKTPFWATVAWSKELTPRLPKNTVGTAHGPNFEGCNSQPIPK